jgi:polysaccharide deacetylase family protein (PEP-CTERM system associated)
VDSATTTNVLSFDLEHWHSATLLAGSVTDPVDRIRESTRIVLDLLARHGVSATFFVVGQVAEEYPALIKRIRAEGHEIASHGQTHTPLFDLDPASFRRELRRSVTAIEDAAGITPAGFRAPNFSITHETPWAVDVLREEGFRYDSSVFPVRTPMYGVSGAPVRPYCPVPEKPFKEGLINAESLFELPLAVFHPRIRLPVAGGFYARLLPRTVLSRGIRTLNARNVPATIYFHPWEFNSAVPLKGIPRHERFVSFHGIDGLRSKLDSLLESFAFGTAKALRERTAGPRPTPARAP